MAAKNGKLICPDCKSDIWTEDGPILLQQPKALKINETSILKKVQHMKCKGCGYKYPDPIEVPETVTIKFKLKPMENKLMFEQTREIQDFRVLIDTLIPDFDFVFLHTLLQWCKLAHDPYHPNQFWEVWIIRLRVPGQIIEKHHTHKTVGICGLYSLIPGSTDELWLGWFGIIPRFRNRNIGKDALLFLEAEARKQGCKKLMSYVDKEGKPLSFYKREGFEVIGTVKEYLTANQLKKIDGEAFENENDFVIQKLL